MSTSKKTITREICACPINNIPKLFKLDKLSTHEDVIRCCIQNKYNLSIEVYTKSARLKKISGL